MRPDQIVWMDATAQAQFIASARADSPELRIAAGREAGRAGC